MVTKNFNKQTKINPRTSNVSLGICIKALCDKEEIPAAFLAERIGMTSSSMSRMMRGTRDLSAVELDQIATYFGIDLNTIFKMAMDADQRGITQQVVSARKKVSEATQSANNILRTLGAEPSTT